MVRVFALVIILFLLTVKTVMATTAAGEIVFSDDFASGLNKWQVARGNLPMWTVIDGILQGEVTTTSTVTELVPLDEHWSPDWQNYELELDLKALAGADRNVAWGYQNESSWYEVHFIPTMAQFARRRNQSLVWYKDKSFTLTQGVWHHLKIKTVNGKLEMWVDGVQIFEFIEPDYDENHGKIALKVGTGITAPARVQFDNIQVRLVSNETEISLAVPVFRQDDRNWADNIYDSAPKWAGLQPPTLQRWGCALTSAVMILRFYGFTTLLDGSPLTPLSLNSWLVSQVDGYVADGWVNWVALVRLARLLRLEWSSSAAPLPQLRYYYRGWSDWIAEGYDAIVSELQSGRPSILELPHHFIVVSGADLATQQLKVIDPLSDKTNLADFAQPISARLWEAQTGAEVLDLSYWVVVFPKGLRIKFITSDGITITRWWLSQDQPGAAETSFESKWQVLTVPEPPKNLTLKVLISKASGDEFLDGGRFHTDDQLALYQPYEVRFFHYDSVANVKTTTLKTYVGVTEQEWVLNFADSELHAELNAESQLNWHNLIQELNQLESDKLLSPVVAARFRHIALYARASDWLEVTPEENFRLNQRYVAWFRNLFKQVQSFNASLMSEVTTRYLDDWLEARYNIRPDE